MRRWRAFVAVAAVNAVVAGVLALAACGPAPGPSGTVAPEGGWREFQGNWNASGRRQVLALGAERRAALIDLTGSMLLGGPSRPGVGFRAQVIGLVDSKAGFVGRAVWTDEKGDQAYSELRGEGTATGNRIEGTFIGGTGRYAGVTGAYEFSWQYVVEGEDGAVQGRAVGLKGRVRVGQPSPGTAPTEGTP